MLPPESGFDLQGIGSQLQRTQPWVRFLAIFGFVSAGLMILGGLFAGAAGALVAAGGQPEAMQLMVLLFVYPLFGVLYIYPSLCLLRYANHIRRFVAAPGAAHLEAALDAQRSFWKFAGILAAISIVATVLLFFLALVAGIAAGVMGQAG
jgi:hypothetical protein